MANDFLRHLDATGGPKAPGDLARGHVEGFLADTVGKGMSPSTVSLTYRALQQWTKWLVEEEELDADPMAKMSTPVVPEVPVPVVPDCDLKQLVAACARRDFVSRRDTALLRMFFDTGGRLSEIAGLGLADVALGRDANLAHVVGKNACLPHPGRPVAAGGGQQLAVGTEGDRAQGPGRTQASPSRA